MAAGKIDKVMWLLGGWDDRVREVYRVFGFSLKFVKTLLRKSK